MVNDRQAKGLVDMTEKPQTRVDRIFRPIVNNPVSSVLIAVGISVIYLASFTEAVDKLKAYFGPSNEEVAEYCELLVPLVAQLDRTKAAFDRWNERNVPLETHIIKPANEAAKNLLLTRADLVHLTLKEDARSLVRHYDCWLVEFVRQREEHGDTGVPFVFVGPQGCGFPQQSEAQFRARQEKLAKELGPSACD